MNRDLGIRLWSAAGAPLAVLRGHSEPVTSLGWSPDGLALASGSYDGTVRLWKPDGGLNRVVPVNAGAVYALAWSPDGKTLATGSVAGPGANVVHLWSGGGVLRATLSTRYSGGKFFNLGWSPDGSLLVGGAIDYTEWRADGTVVFSHPGSPNGTPAWGFAWAPDGLHWAIGNESGHVWIYGIDGGPPVERDNSYNVDSLAWAPEGVLVAGGNTLWSGKTFERAASLGGGRTGSLGWSADGTLLAVAPVVAGTLFLYDAAGRRLALLEGHRDAVAKLSWSPRGHVLATGSLDRTIRLWRFEGFR